MRESGATLVAIQPGYVTLALLVLLITPGTAVGWQAGASLPILPLAAARDPGQEQSKPAGRPQYTLTPQRRAKAIAYSHSLYSLYFTETLVSLAIYLLLWLSGIATVFSSWAHTISGRLFVQCLVFIPLFVAAVALLNLPLSLYGGYVLEHRFGLSTEGFTSWLGDWGKALGLTMAGGVIVAWVFFTVVRRSPGRWWFYFWLATIPLVLSLILIEPYVVEPLFYRFTPLAQTRPALAARIETMMRRAGLSVPPSHIFEMNASSRTNAINAYVSGLGASKRVVVWDTTIKDLDPDELLLVLGHETGHYVLHHIPKEFAWDELVALAFFYLGFRLVARLMKFVEGAKQVELTDLASLPLVLIVLTLLMFLSDPIVNGVSRHYEHQADQFGLEVAYGIVGDPNAAEVQSLQILGDIDLADPDPSSFIKFWLYTHPPLAERIRFAAEYKPWAHGQRLNLLPNYHEGER